VQVGLSLIDYVEDRPYIARCGELGIPVTIYEPLTSGILSGKTMEQVQAAWEGPWRESSFYKRLLGPGNAERSFAVADGLRPIAEALNATVAQVAIAWVLHQPGVTAAIGGSRSERHVSDNGGAPRLALSPEILGQIEGLIPLGPTVAAPA
jgi:aryl-alcohol dehydrogenase-like predicted oxidoreductase